MKILHIHEIAGQASIIAEALKAFGVKSEAFS